MSEQAVVFGLPSMAAAPSDMMEYTGINALHRPSDRISTGVLDEPYRGFEEIGDDGLLAWMDDQLAGWLWLRNGPFEERVGWGVVVIPSDARVLRHVEVVPNARNRGVATELLRELTRRLGSETNIIAFVGVSNLLSIKAFQAAGYKRLSVVTFRSIMGRTIRVTLPSRSQAVS